MAGKNDGTALESLVQSVEERLASADCKIEPRYRIYSESGVQIAELDLLITAKVGSGTFLWLLECRDRQKEGRQGSEWIQQLVGRRDQFKVDRVTAVSTTGFVDEAVRFAKEKNIELREVRSLSAKDFDDWLVMRYITQRRHITTLDSTYLELSPDDLSSEAVISECKALDLEAPILVDSSTGTPTTLRTAFAAAVSVGIPRAFDELTPESAPSHVGLHVIYSNEESHFVLPWSGGNARVMAIRFTGRLRVEETQLPIVETTEYRVVNGESFLAQVVKFAPTTAGDVSFQMEIYRLGETGETFVSAKPMGALPPPPAKDPLG